MGRARDSPWNSSGSAALIETAVAIREGLVETVAIPVGMSRLSRTMLRGRQADVDVVGERHTREPIALLRARWVTVLDSASDRMGYAYSDGSAWRCDLPKQSPVPDELDKPFWDACNEGRLVIQNCTACNRLQHPPQPTCAQCGAVDHLEWRAVGGSGKIYSYAVVHDSPVVVLGEEQPFNLVVIQLEEDPGINMLSHLPGTPVDQVPVGATVQVVFETTPATGQKVSEWRVVG